MTALNARCGGDFWDGPSCCAVNLGCIWKSAALSKCEGCAALYGQCGGTDPGTNNRWSKQTCCPSGAQCKQVSNTYSQCVPSK